jgi:hypothetical protein
MAIVDASNCDGHVLLSRARMVAQRRGRGRSILVA